MAGHQDEVLVVEGEGGEKERERERGRTNSRPPSMLGNVRPASILMGGGERSRAPTFERPLSIIGEDKGKSSRFVYLLLSFS